MWRVWETSTPILTGHGCLPAKSRVLVRKGRGPLDGYVWLPNYEEPIYLNQMEFLIKNRALVPVGSGEHYQPPDPIASTRLFNPHPNLHLEGSDPGLPDWAEKLMEEDGVDPSSLTGLGSLDEIEWSEGDQA